MLYIGNEDGNVTAMGLSDSGYVSDFPEEVNSSMTDPIFALERIFEYCGERPTALSTT